MTKPSKLDIINPIQILGLIDPQLIFLILINKWHNFVTKKC